MTNFFQSGRLAETSFRNIYAFQSTAYQKCITENLFTRDSNNVLQYAKQFKQAADQGERGSVFRAVLNNFVLKARVEDLLKIFSQFGTVVRILIIQDRSFQNYY